MREHFIQRLGELVLQDPDILLITGDLGFGVFNDFRENYSANFINVGVAEQQMIGLATGLALEGKTTFTYSIANFAALRCLEQIRNDAAYHGANVNVVCIGGGFSYGALGISHHATEDLAILRSIPDITVVAPCGHWETMAATAAIAQEPGTAYLRLDKSAGDDSEITNSESFTLGRARILRPGTDCAIITTGGILEEVQKAVSKANDESTQLKLTVNNLRDTLEKNQIDIEERIQKSVAVVNDENKQLKGTVKSIRDELEKTQIGQEEVIQKSVARVNDENKQLKGTVNNLRDTLEKTQIDIDERIQKSVASVNDVNKQLKGTVNSLRDRIERKEAQRLEELQLAAKIKRDEHSQLEDIINTLREKLEVQNGNEN